MFNAIRTSLNSPQYTSESNIFSKQNSSFSSSVSNQSFPLKLGSDIISVYCHVTSLGPCGDGGWTLVMKINGSKVHKIYSSFQSLY